ncbi:MAG: nuclear transport factor 2 family protein [Chloroflexi bacterium]|nr:nuclear transport factor 2 family protein [Chloroflexota bacterium]
MSHLPAAHAQAAHQPSALAVVQKYFNAFNAGMQNGNFNGLRSIYAPNAVLTTSNPLGESKVSHGIVQIIAFYQAAYVKFHGFHWTQDSTRLLSKDVVLNYEFATTGGRVSEPGRCAHVFVIKNGKINTLDWITFYSGQT